MGQTASTTPTEEFNGKGVGTTFVGSRDEALDGKELKFLRVYGNLTEHNVARLAREAKPHYKTPSIDQEISHHHR